VKWAGILADWLAPERLYLVENAGHMTNYEKPEEVNERLASFSEMSGE
jgi:pimeloyl-ACP methyl ester carboxylesterase